MPITNASMLDEATAAAEAMTLAKRVAGSKSSRFLVDRGCHPQTIEVLATRAEPLGIELVLGDIRELLVAGDCFGVLVSYPTTEGDVPDWRDMAELVHAKQGLLCVATDPLALTLLVPPGEWGADIVVGSMQRFGMPMGCGGPHAAFFACRDEFKRSLPGRLVGGERGSCRPAGLSAGAPDPRAAHSSGEGHEQYLHGPGAARGGGLHVCGL